MKSVEQPSNQIKPRANILNQAHLEFSGGTLALDRWTEKAIKKDKKE